MAPRFRSLPASGSRKHFIKYGEKPRDPTLELFPESLEAERLYKLLAALVVPRPIAWVTTLSPSGLVNAAPYSFFNILSDKPPVVAFGAAARRNGQPKDTAANIEARQEFVVNLVDTDTLAAMEGTSADYAPGVSETEALGLATEPCRRVETPRIASAPVSLECRLRQTLHLSERARIVLGDVVAIHVRDALFADPCRLHVDLAAYRPIGRLHGRQYVAVAGHVIDLATGTGNLS